MLLRFQACVLQPRAAHAPPGPAAARPQPHVELDRRRVLQSQALSQHLPGKQVVTGGIRAYMAPPTQHLPGKQVLGKQGKQVVAGGMRAYMAPSRLLVWVLHPSPAGQHLTRRLKAPLPIHHFEYKIHHF